MELTTWGTIAGISLAIATVGSILYPVVKKLMKKAWVATFGCRNDQLDRIEAELMHNGGSSLKDLVYDIRGQIAESKALQLAYFATREEAVWIADAEGDCIWASPAFQRLTGRTAAELHGKGWINVFPQRLREQLQHEWYDNAVADDRNFEHCAKIKIEGDGEVNVLITGVRMVDKGDVLGYFGTMKVYDEIT